MRRGLVLGLVVLTSACASYQPRAGRYIVRVNRDVFRRDGQVFRIGSLGGGADALVAGNDGALAYARECQRLNRKGAVISALGLATMFVGLPLANEGEGPAASTALGVGAAISVVGMVFLQRGDAALLDAVNVYNDGLAAAAGARRE